MVLLSGVLISENDKYLLVQESQDKAYSKCKDKWTLPHGSYDKKTESIQQLAERELLEETGGKADFSGNYICIEGYAVHLSKLFLTCIIWSASGWKKVQEKLKDEIKDVGFFSKDEILRLYANNQIRDNLPIVDIIEHFEGTRKGIIRWNLDLK